MFVTGCRTRAELDCSTHLNVPFLNLMALIADRAGEVQVRVGGNTQDYAKMVDSTSDGRVLEKEQVDTNNPVCAETRQF